MFEGLQTFNDARQIPDGSEVACDLCIIGSGAAGITLAKEFAHSDIDVVILESGGLDYSEAAHALQELVVTGRHYSTNESRLRFFGGTTYHWGGHCIPLRRNIFEKRDWMPNGEWPFDLSHIEPYYARAHNVIQLGPYEYDPRPIADQLNLPLLPLNADNVETVLARFNQLQFGVEYRKLLDQAPNIRTFLFATANALHVSTDMNRVTGVDVQTEIDRRFFVTAKVIVLAAGGIENARLLLMSRQQLPAGVGNQNDLVGRYFSDHIWYESGYILPVNQNPKVVEMYADQIPFGNNYRVSCHLALPEARVQELQIPEFRAALIVEKTYRYHEAVDSARRIRRRLIEMDAAGISFQDILDVIGDPMALAAFLADRRDGPLVYALSNTIESVPNPESRVLLSDEKDALGMNRPELRWKLSSLDKEAIVKAQRVIAAEVGRSGVGRMQIVIPDFERTMLEGAFWGNHHMGTTRMHVDPKRGVVDADARVHGMANLFIAGSSIFPSFGTANPTLTIVALSIRLADHIKMVVMRET